MTYRLKSNEKPARGILRIARCQVNGIRKSVENTRDEFEAVHNARMRIKRLRALAQLIRKPTGRKLYAECDELLKDIDKSLAPVRDANVQMDTLLRLQKAHPEWGTQRNIQSLQKILSKTQASHLHAAAKDQKWRKRKIRELLKLIKLWPLKGLKKTVLNKGIAQSRNRLSAGFHKAEQSPTVEHLHAWRKAAKDLTNQLTVVECIEPVANGQMTALKKLGQLLGDDHDLAMFEAKADKLKRPLWKPIQIAIRKKRMALQKAAFDLGRKLKAV